LLIALACQTSPIDAPRWPATPGSWHAAAATTRVGMIFPGFSQASAACFQTGGLRIGYLRLGFWLCHHCGKKHNTGGHETPTKATSYETFHFPSSDLFVPCQRIIVLLYQM
jgi:ribosomal protein L37AE/L43A